MITPQLVNEWRILPRVIVALFMYLCYWVASWYMNLGDPSTQQAAFVSTVFATVPMVFNFYCQTGDKK